MPSEHESVHMTMFPRMKKRFAPIFRRNKSPIWELLSKVRAEVLKALEAARNEKKINAGLEAKVLLNAELE